MKSKLVSLNIIFTLLFLIMSALFLIYIFRNIQDRREGFLEGDSYSWKYGESNTCDGDLNTNTELRNTKSAFNINGYNRFDNTQLYKKDNLRNASHPYRNYCDVMTYNDLLAYKCLNKSPIAMREVLERTTVDIASTIDYIYVYDEKSLYSFILSKIQAKKEALGTKIAGPVYVCISQSPYLRYKNEHTKTDGIDKLLGARIDILNNRNPYYFEKISSSGAQSFSTTTSDGTETDASSSPIISSLYCHILIVYPLYTRAMVLKETLKSRQTVVIKKFLEETMTTHYTDNELCFIKCNKSTTLNCGCLTRTTVSPEAPLNTFFTTADTTVSPLAALNTFFSFGSPAAAGASSGSINDARDKPSYQSICYDHTNNNAPSNFTMMYFVNPYSDKYGEGGIITDPEPNPQMSGLSQDATDAIYYASNTCTA